MNSIEAYQESLAEAFSEGAPFAVVESEPMLWTGDHWSPFFEMPEIDSPSSDGFILPPPLD